MGRGKRAADFSPRLGSAPVATPVAVLTIARVSRLRGSHRLRIKTVIIVAKRTKRAPRAAIDRNAARSTWWRRRPGDEKKVTTRTERI